MSSSSAIELDAPAKLNLYLEVTGRRPDGYHDLDSVFTAIDLADRVRLERADRISLEVTGLPAPDGPDNLAWRAAEALGVGARIRLHKRIPAGAGLGGGSSDAAAVLLGLDRLYGLGLPPERLVALGARLGADVPFFLAGGGLARCTGIGDRVEPLPSPGPRDLLLLLPDFGVSTAEVYRAIDSSDAGLTPNVQIAIFFLRKYLRRGEVGPVPYFNRLQAVAERLDPRLSEVREAAERRFGAVFTMTGSGSGYFGEVKPEGDPGSTFVVGTVSVRQYAVRAS